MHTDGAQCFKFLGMLVCQYLLAVVCVLAVLEAAADGPETTVMVSRIATAWIIGMDGWMDGWMDDGWMDGRTSE